MKERIFAVTCAVFSLALARGDRAWAKELSKAGAEMVEMEVKDVISPPGSGGFVVLLKERKANIVVPISVGPAEGLVISMRLARQKAPRPLTHDLLDEVLKLFGAKLVKVHVEDIKEQVFLGRIFLERNGRGTDLDARPSDAMAMALSSGAPIFCSMDVIRKAGIDLDKIPKAPQPGKDKTKHGPVNKGESL